MMLGATTPTGTTPTFNRSCQPGFVLDPGTGSCMDATPVTTGPNPGAGTGYSFQDANGAVWYVTPDGMQYQISSPSAAGTGAAVGAPLTTTGAAQLIPGLSNETLVVLAFLLLVMGMSR
ncbi:MAG: hypothetical protein U0Q18_25375 [Bryobacteraceae bacterium]